MRAHMPGIRLQRHGAKNRPRGDLQDHHDGSEQYNVQGFPLVRRIYRREIMLMLPFLQVINMHATDFNTHQLTVKRRRPLSERPYNQW
jgi:hypothetical protein